MGLVCLHLAARHKGLLVKPYKSRRSCSASTTAERPKLALGYGNQLKSDIFGKICSGNKLELSRNGTSSEAGIVEWSDSEAMLVM